MKNSILRSTGTLPIAASFMLMPSLFFAQTEKQVAAIKKASNLKVLRTLEKGLKKSTLNTKQLKAKAQEKGVEYSGSGNGKFFQLKGFEPNTDRPIYYVTNNVEALVGTSTDKINSTGGIFNLDGEGMTVYEWDGGGTLVEHKEFGGRATQGEGEDADFPIPHATHVAGTLIASGVDKKARGMAPKAKLMAYDWTDDDKEMIEAAKNGALISNHSYGLIGGFEMGNMSGTTGWHWFGDDADTEFRFYGKYTSEDVIWDLIGSNAPYFLPVKAAGNPRGEGPERGGEHFIRVKNKAGEWVWRKSTKVRQKNGGNFGFDCVNTGSLGKNILTVGAAYKIPNGYKKPTDVEMAPFSAFGPVDDSRIKPDITGIGMSIYSTDSYHDGMSYDIMSGTSMAAPNVTGSLLLLQEHYKNVNNGKFMKAATLKALAIATADEAGEYDGPDYASGFGLLNAYKAASAITTNGKYTHIEEKTLKNNTSDKITVKASGTEPLIVTIAWIDPVPKTLPKVGLDDATPVLVNDLDVRVKHNGTTHLPWTLSARNPMYPAIPADNKVDNVEQIVIKEPVPGGVYEIEIGHKNSLKKNKLTTTGEGKLVVDLEDATEQDYSIVVTGMNNGVNTDLAVKSVVVTVTPDEYSTTTPVEIEIENKGLGKVSNAKVKYELIDQDNNNAVISSNTFVINEIESGKVHKETVNVDLSKSFVNYKILATVDFAEDQIEINNKSEALAYGYVTDLTPENATYFFDFEDNFAKNGWTSEDVNGNGRTWEKYDDASFAKNGTGIAMNFPNNADADDWLFSNPIKMKGGVKYRVTFFTRKPKSANEPLSLFFGNEAESSAMTNAIKENIEVTQSYVKHLYSFTPSEDGTYHLGFHHQSTDAPYAVLIDDIYIDRSERAIVDFEASKTTVNSITPITFTNTTLVGDGGTTTYEWSFEPSTYKFVGGTDKNSENPKVVFSAQGQYSATLKATNSKGEATHTKKDFILVRNIPVEATFFTSRFTLYEGQTAPITSSVSGNPRPNQFNWVITPSEGVEFANGTSASSREPIIRFNKAGKYTITQTAKSEVDEHTHSRKDYIEVLPLRGAVKDLKAEVDSDTKTVKLDWKRPVLAPSYWEDFEGNISWQKVVFPKDLTVIDGNKDKRSWRQSSVSNSAYWGAFNVSWDIEVDDWLILPKQQKGAELMEYAVNNASQENYEIYIAPAPADGSTPKVEDFTATTPVFTSTPEDVTKDFEFKRLSIKDYTKDSDFFIAFRHNSKKAPERKWLMIDDISVGYDNGIDVKPINNKVNSIKNPRLEEMTKYYNDHREREANPNKIAGEVIPVEEYLSNIEKERLAENPKANEDVTTQSYLPVSHKIVGYEVLRDGVLLTGTINEKTNTTFDYSDVVSADGKYTYTINAVYSDGTKLPATIEANVGNLSTSEVKDSSLKIYPNPSDGRFVVEAKSNISSLKAEVYDMSGKLIFKNEFKGNKADLNLTQYPKGVYILNLVDNNGEKHSAKLMIK